MSYSTLQLRNAVTQLEVQLQITDDVFIGAWEGDRNKFYSTIRESIMDHRCSPHEISATVVEDGVSGHVVGEMINGICVAKNGGYWLVFRPEEETFYAFWGHTEKSLGWHGIYGSPMYCWTA